MAPRAARDRKVVLVAWDTADWKLIHPLLDSGRMPHLAALIERGVSGTVTGPPPLVPPILWTSVVTGKPPDRHGILGFEEPDPAGGGARPSSSTSRQTKALWNILSEAGLNVGAVGWPASHPAEPVNGTAVSDAYALSVAPPGAPWPLAPGSVYPEELGPALAGLRVHAGDLTAEDLFPFVPQIAAVNQERDRRLVVLADALAESIGVHAAATWTMEQRPWDFLGVHYRLLAHTARAFLRFHPPRMADVSEEDFALYQGVVSGAYRFADMMLGRLVELAGADATFLVVSACGCHSDHARPPARSDGEAWLRPQGILCAAGPGTQRDELVFGTGVLDLAPTVLALFGLPAGEDMPGRVLLDAFGMSAPAERIPTWETGEGADSSRDGEWDDEQREVEAAIRELASMGYTDPAAGQREQQARTAALARTFNLARVYQCSGRAERAMPLFESAHRESPGDAGIAACLALCCYQAGRFERCRELIAERLAGREHAPLASALEGALLLGEGSRPEGLARLRAAEQTPEAVPSLVAIVARVYLDAGLWSDAERAYGALLAADPDSAAAYEGLARALLGRRKLREAAGAALEAIARNYYLPVAHSVLGSALTALGETERGRTALELGRRLAGKQGWPNAEPDRSPAA